MESPVWYHRFPPCLVREIDCRKAKIAVEKTTEEDNYESKAKVDKELEEIED